jgi:cell wall-associated NlpC family hydrolase
VVTLHRWLVRAALPGLLAGAAACATAGPARPAPFPGAAVSSDATPPPPPAAPASITPAPAVAKPSSTAIVETALSLRGVPYRLGGDDPAHGFDCSGFVHYVFAAYHVEVPRTVAELAHAGTAESARSLRAGDLVFFSTKGPGATHVGIALGADQFIHAPSSNGTVRVESLASSYWHDRFVEARRVF